MIKKWIVLTISVTSLVISQSPQASYGQSPSTRYLDEDYFPIEKDSAIYFRLVEPHPDGTKKVFAKTYYLSGQLESTATYLSDVQLTKHFYSTSYYENGKKKEEGNYSNGAQDGQWTEWYPNGQMKEVGFYANIKDLNHLNYRLSDYWDEKGNQVVIEGNGSVINYFDESEEGIISTGEYKNGFKTGLWKGTNEDGSPAYEEIYKKSKITGVSWDQHGNEYSYKVTEEPSYPKNGINSFYNYIAKKLKYPDVARKMNVEGKIYTRFVIDTTGSITDIRILKGICLSCDQEVINALKKAKPWIPGKQRGQVMKTAIILPVTFKLQDADKNSCDDCSHAN